MPHNPCAAQSPKSAHQRATPAQTATHQTGTLLWPAPMKPLRPWLLVFAQALLVPLLSAAEPEAVVVSKKPPAVPNRECMDCHEAEFISPKKGLPPQWVGVRPELFAKSVHGKLNCVDCHADITDATHPSKLAPAQCASCHEQAVKQYATSIHGMSHKMGASDAASCASCHGTHDMVPVKQADSPVFKLNLPNTCGSCHDNAKLTTEYRMGKTEAAGHYLDSIHGQ